MDFQVNYAALDAAAADINTGAANLEAALDELEQILNQLRSSWEGQTQEAYDEAQRRWNQGLEGLKDVLRRTSSAVDAARTNYHTPDQSTAARFCEHEPLALWEGPPRMGRPFSVSCALCRARIVSCARLAGPAPTRIWHSVRALRGCSTAGSTSLAPGVIFRRVELTMWQAAENRPFLRRGQRREAPD